MCIRDSVILENKFNAGAASFKNYKKNHTNWPGVLQHTWRSVTVILKSINPIKSTASFIVISSKWQLKQWTTCMFKLIFVAKCISVMQKCTEDIFKYKIHTYTHNSFIKRLTNAAYSIQLTSHHDK